MLLFRLAIGECISSANVLMTLDNVRKNSAVLADLEKEGTIKIAGAMYYLQTAAMDFLN